MHILTKEGGIFPEIPICCLQPCKLSFYLMYCNQMVTCNQTGTWVQLHFYHCVNDPLPNQAHWATAHCPDPNVAGQAFKWASFAITFHTYLGGRDKKRSHKKHYNAWTCPIKLKCDLKMAPTQAHESLFSGPVHAISQGKHKLEETNQSTTIWSSRDFMYFG